MGAAFGVDLASEALAKAAVVALAELDAIGFVYARDAFAAGAGRVVAERATRPLEQLPGVRWRERRVGIVGRARTFEGIAAIDALAVEIVPS